MHIANTHLARQMDAILQRIGALDVAATGLAAGIQASTIDGAAAYELIDVIAVDLRRKVLEVMQQLARLPCAGIMRRPANEPEQMPEAACAADRGNRPTPASSGDAR